MTIRNFDALFAPKSVVLIGASDVPGSVGSVIAHNLLARGFAGDIAFINRRAQTIEGRATVPSIEALPFTPDLAVIATPPNGIPAMITDLGARGCRAAIIISASAGGQEWRSTLVNAAAPNLLRILGPNCLGFQSPTTGLNASFAHLMPKAGRVALVSQSGAVLAAVIDWAAGRGIGFSHVISLGDMVDIDFGDVLDFLALDPATDAILLYVESITHARKFMSAGRIAARTKPVVVVKAGRSDAGAKAAATHTGALAGSDLVYDAAFRRAGMLRVRELEHLFDAAEILSSGIRVHGDRLAVLTNGGGAGVMATDALVEEHGTLATLSSEAIGRLDTVLPATWSRANPVDIIGDAHADRYRHALQAMLADDTQDAILVINCPTGVANRLDSAQAVIDISSDEPTPILTCWLGERTAQESRALFNARRVPTFSTPTEGVEAFMQIATYSRNQAQLLQTPAASVVKGDRQKARAILEAAAADKRRMLTEPEAKGLLLAYEIPTTLTLIAHDPAEAAARAAEVGFPVALKILSPDISHKSDVGGVRLDLPDRASVLTTATKMMEDIGRLAPAAQLTGFTVQLMVSKPKGIELLAGFHVDQTFGPVILFGAGGVAVEVIADRAAALPPLNSILAKDLMERTRVYKLLAGYRDVPAADFAAIERVLLGISKMIADLPEIIALDINPLLVDAAGVIALDARIALGQSARQELAICPYPDRLARNVVLPAGTFHVRPIRPEDEPALVDMTNRSSLEDMRARFLGALRSLPHALAARLSQIDYDREMAFVAVGHADGALVAVCRIVIDPNFQEAEYAIMVRTDLKGLGLGGALTEAIFEYARERGVKEVWGDALADNTQMLNLAGDFDASIVAHPTEPGVLRMRFPI
jgi:acetyltransferase